MKIPKVIIIMLTLVYLILLISFFKMPLLALSLSLIVIAPVMISLFDFKKFNDKFIVKLMSRIYFAYGMISGTFLLLFGFRRYYARLVSKYSRKAKLFYTFYDHVSGIDFRIKFRPGDKVYFIEPEYMSGSVSGVIKDIRIEIIDFVKVSYCVESGFYDKDVFVSEVYSTCDECLNSVCNNNDFIESVSKIILQ